MSRVISKEGLKTVYAPVKAKGQIKKRKPRASRSPVYIGNNANTLEAAQWLR